MLDRSSSSFLIARSVGHDHACCRPGSYRFDKVFVPPSAKRVTLSLVAESLFVWNLLLREACIRPGTEGLCTLDDQRYSVLM